MPFEFIQIPANGPGNAKEELNKLLRGGRIASVRKEFVPNGEDSFWAFHGLNRPPSCSSRQRRNDETQEVLSDAGRPVETGSKAPGGAAALHFPPSS